MSEEKTFNDPKLAINRVYTRKGDGGGTRLVGGQKVSKGDLRIESYGTIDELNAFIGAARQTILDQHAENERLQNLGKELLRVQHELFNLGSVLATLPEDATSLVLPESSIGYSEFSIETRKDGLPNLIRQYCVNKHIAVKY